MDNPLTLLVETLREVRELIDGYIDIKDGGIPNDAMKATHLIDDALLKVTGSTA